jgi:MFS family permease
MRAARDLENTFARAWQLMVHNWIIVIVPLIFGIAGGLFEFFLDLLFGTYAITGNGTPDALFAIHEFVDIVILLTSTGVALIQMAYVTGMAGGAWEHGRATLADGADAFARRFGSIVGAAILLFVLAICAAALAPATFFLTVIAFVVLCIYTMASVIIGEHAAVDAVLESCRLSAANLGPTAGVAALIFAIATLGGVAGQLLGSVSNLLGWVVAGILQQVIVAYASLVIAGEYLKLRGRQTGSE